MVSVRHKARQVVRIAAPDMHHEIGITISMWLRERMERPLHREITQR